MMQAGGAAERLRALAAAGGDGGVAPVLRKRVRHLNADGLVLRPAGAVNGGVEGAVGKEGKTTESAQAAAEIRSPGEGIAPGPVGEPGAGGVSKDQIVAVVEEVLARRPWSQWA